MIVQKHGHRSGLFQYSANYLEPVKCSIKVVQGIVARKPIEPVDFANVTDQVNYNSAPMYC